MNYVHPQSAKPQHVDIPGKRPEGQNTRYGDCLHFFVDRWRWVYYNVNIYIYM